MLIRISGNTKIAIYGSPKDEIRAELDGLTSDQSCCEHLPNFLRDMGLCGGHIQLRSEDGGSTFRVLTEYRSPAELSESHLAQLARATAGQWSDGLGAGCFEEDGRRLGARIELLPFSQRDDVAFEQLDDGLPTPTVNRSVFIAARDGNYEALCELLDKGEEVNVVHDGSTPLIASALRGHKSVALELIRRGADVFARDDSGYDALMAVAIGNGVEDHDAFAIAHALLERGVSPKGERGDHTPHYFATIRGKAKLAALLFDAGAEPEDGG